MKPDAFIRHTNMSECPACGYQISIAFYTGGDMPLATLEWPESQDEATSLKRHPLDYVRCVECGHVYNMSFDYRSVPYSKKPNLMFNKGNDWAQFIITIQNKIIEKLLDRPVVVEIGHGCGAFLNALAKLRPSGKFIGFDPNGSAIGNDSVEFRQELFMPFKHIQELQPDIIISRHVLEHLTNPLRFLQQISYSSTCLTKQVTAYFEVPCIDRAIESGRTVDFYYEHNSQFTTSSFTKMMSRCSTRIDEIGHGYDKEVVYAFAELGNNHDQINISSESLTFLKGAQSALKTILMQLAEIHASGKKIVVWGGTGKSAAFMARYQMDSSKFPYVVDSDPDKAGTYVPGTGQKILFRDWLKENHVDVVIIPPQWRARDIVKEIHENDILIAEILIEHNGRLISYLNEPNPYT